MVFPNITRKNNASALNTEKKLFDTDVNQLLDAVQDGTKDIKTNSVTCIGNYVYLNTNKGIRYDTVTSKVQVSHNGVSWSDIGDNPSSLSLTAGEAISNNLFCDIGTDGKTYKSSGTKGIGFTKTSVVLNGTVEVQISGVVNGFTGLTIGSTYYAGLNGVISTSVSSIEVGVALSATSLFIGIKSNETVIAGLSGAQNAYQTLQANNIFQNKDFLFTDEFVTSAGTNGTVNTGSSTALFSTNLYKLGATAPYTSGKTVVCDTGTLTLDGTEKSLVIYVDKTTPTNTSITLDVSDGTTTLSAQPLNSVIDVSTLGAGTLSLTFNLATTDTTVTPTLIGYGGFIK